MLDESLGRDGAWVAGILLTLADPGDAAPRG
jgi:hypothetical protein